MTSDGDIEDIEDEAVALEVGVSSEQIPEFVTQTKYFIPPWHQFSHKHNRH